MSVDIEIRDYDSIKAAVEREPGALMLQAAANDMNFSQFLNRSCPDILLNEKRNIANKLMEDFGYVARGTDYVAPTTADEFFQTLHGRTLAYDYLYRNHFSGMGVREVPMLPVSSTDSLYPEAVSMPAMENPPQPRFDPNVLVGLQSNAASSTYKVFRWKPTESDVRRERVMPGSKFATMQLAEQDAPINLHKWGVAAELTYEAIRRQSLDKVGALINLEMMVESKRQLSEFVKVLRDGDERDGKEASDGTTLNTKAVTVNRSVIDSGSNAKEITLKGLMLFLGGWPTGYTCNYLVARLARAVDIALLTNGSQNTPISFLTEGGNIPGFTIPGLGGNVTVLIADDDDIGEDEILGIASAAALEKVNEIGSDIREQAQQIDNQTTLMTFSDTYGLAKLILNTTRVYNLA